MSSGKEVAEWWEHDAEMVVMEDGICRELQKFTANSLREGEANVRMEVWTGARSWKVK